jgi:hypothetical protein
VRRIVEAAALAVALALSSWLIFGQAPGEVDGPFRQPYALFPVLISVFRPRFILREAAKGHRRQAVEAAKGAAGSNV